jgi:hypothetical protein
LTTQHAFDERARSLLNKIADADIVVGIPSYNNAATIGHVARSAAEGLAKHFPGATALLMNSDGGSSDATCEAFMETPTPECVHKLAARYRGVPGKGSAFRAIFEAVKMLGSRACVVVDSDLRSITPEWIKLLGRPILDDGAGYITPLYARHKYDGTITNSLAYPMTRALYGMRVRQPIGGDFGFSGALAASFLDKDVWQSAAAQFGIDIFMTTTAVNEGFDVRQANLGVKIHDAKDPAAALGPMFRQVVGTMFALMGKYADKWHVVNGSSTTPTVGPALDIEPEPVAVTLSALIDKFKGNSSCPKTRFQTSKRSRGSMRLPSSSPRGYGYAWCASLPPPTTRANSSPTMSSTRSHPSISAAPPASQARQATWTPPGPKRSSNPSPTCTNRKNPTLSGCGTIYRRVSPT